MAVFDRLANLFRRGRLESEIAAELESHIEMRREANIASGMTPEEARREARLRFGNTTSTRERVVAADAALGLESWWADVRYAVRKLAKSPGFTATAVITLAVGIGANTAIFSSMDAVVLRPLAVPALDRVVTLAGQTSNGYQRVALADYAEWVRASHAFEQLSARSEMQMNLTGAGDATQVEAALTSASFFSALRLRTVLGRLYSDEECQTGRDDVAVLNYGFWKRRFGGDPSVVGRRVELNERVYTVIGVLPKSVQYPSLADVFLPLAPTPQQVQDRKDHSYFVMGRLRDGVTVNQAQAEMQMIAERLAKAYPTTNGGLSAHVEPLLDGINGHLTPMYYRLVMGATLFVLLVVCANVANLQIARGIDARSEIAMRTALGASRWRLVRQMMIENLMLGVAGAAGGLLLGRLDLHVMGVFMPERVARYIAGWSNVSFNGRVFAFSVGIAVMAGLISGFAPTIDALRVNTAEQLKAGSRSNVGSRRNHRLRSIFAVAQISLAVALVIGAALISKGMRSMLHAADAFQPDRTLTFNVSLPPARYGTARKRVAWYEASLERLRAIPGVKRVELASALPYTDAGWIRDCVVEDRPVMPGKFQTALYLPVSEGFFSALRIPIVSGRGFSRSDSLDSVPVAVVSERFVAQYFPGENPIGRRIRLGGQDNHDAWLTIVGVAQQTNYSLWDMAPGASVYADALQVAPTGIQYTLITDGEPLALGAPARQALSAVDPGLPLNALVTYAQLMYENLTGLIYVAVLLGIDALVALLLAGIGIFGVMANLVGERTREIGVRIAMGARRQDVVQMILRRASLLTGVGLGSGLVLAFVLAHLVSNLLRGVRSNDPVVFTTITIFIAVTALASSWIPARRAARVDPMQALRSE